VFLVAAKRFVVAMAASQFFPLSLLREKNWGPWGSHEQSWEGCISCIYAEPGAMTRILEITWVVDLVVL